MEEISGGLPLSCSQTVFLSEALLITFPDKMNLEGNHPESHSSRTRLPAGPEIPNRGGEGKGKIFNFLSLVRITERSY